MEFFTMLLPLLINLGITILIIAVIVRAYKKHMHKMDELIKIQQELIDIEKKKQ